MRAPEFPNSLRWLNSQPIKTKDLRGKAAVLVDFWTYSCINCIRTLPHVKEWHKKYSDKGLVVIGVHTPEFEFEKNVENVSRAVKEFGIAYPVVMDNDYEIWSLYSNNVWPRKFLINKDGQIVYDHAGEGGYRETEEALQRTLLEIKPGLKFSEVAGDGGSGGVCFPTTPETYLGSMRGRPGKIWNCHGVWKIHSEFIEHERQTQNFEDYISINFEANEVNLVMETMAERPAKTKVELDGKLIKELDVQDAKLYNLFSDKKMTKGQLKIFVKDPGLRAYAFTFGGCSA